MKSKDVYKYGDSYITNVKMKPHKDIPDLVEFYYDVLEGRVMKTTLVEYHNADGKAIWVDYYVQSITAMGEFFQTRRTEQVTEEPGEPSTLYYVSEHRDRICGSSTINIIKSRDDVAVYVKSYVDDMLKRHSEKVKNRLKELNDKAEAEFKAREADQKAFHDKMDAIAKEAESESVCDFLRSLFKRNKI